MSTTAERRILHVDMDAFFASVEQRDHPELRGRPVLVGGSPEGRGVVSAASYEARPAGCRSAMPMAEALRLCPDAVVVRPRMARYVEVSRAVFEVFAQFTPLVEPLSIDEAFLDVTGSVRLLGSAEQMGRELKRRVHARTQLTCSVGVAPNKFLAKLASDLRKPNGLVVVPPDDIQAFLDPLPIARLWGAGTVTLKRFESLGVLTFGDARRLGPNALCRHFGEVGRHFHGLLHGRDDRPVVPDREAKSIGHETTFAVDVDDDEHVRAVALDLMEQVAARLRRHELLARTVTIKVRTADFKTFTRSRTLENPTDRTDRLWGSAAELLEGWLRARRLPVRLVGVSTSRFSTVAARQLSLFDQPREDRRRALDRTLDQIRARYGSDSISRAGSIRYEEDQYPPPLQGGVGGG